MKGMGKLEIISSQYWAVYSLTPQKWIISFRGKNESIRDYYSKLVYYYLEIYGFHWDKALTVKATQFHKKATQPRFFKQRISTWVYCITWPLRLFLPLKIFLAQLSLMLESSSLTHWRPHSFRAKSLDIHLFVLWPLLLHMTVLLTYKGSFLQLLLPDLAAAPSEM